MRRGGDRRYQGESEKERRGEMQRLSWDYAFATRGRRSGKWRGRIDCTLSYDPHSFNRKCSRWQSAQFLCVFVSVSACVCVKVWVQQSHQPKPIRLWLRLAQGRPSPPLPFSVGSRSQLVGWQPAVGGLSTCAGLINHPSQWQPNRAWPIHEYFPAMAEEARMEVELCPKAWCTPGRTLI